MSELLNYVNQDDLKICEDLYYDGYRIGYNVWESTRYSEQFFQQLLTLDELWVPTQWQKQI